MESVFITAAVRTAVGRGKKDGGLASVHPVELSAEVMRAAIREAGIEPAILDTGRDKDGLAADLRTVGECDDANAGVDPETLHGAGHGDARTKFLRLKQCVAHEFRPGYAQGETEVVLDP